MKPGTKENGHRLTNTRRRKAIDLMLERKNRIGSLRETSSAIRGGSTTNRLRLNNGRPLHHNDERYMYDPNRAVYVLNSFFFNHSHSLGNP